MELSRDFEKRLKEVFGDRLRMRWSASNDEWVVEQKVGPARVMPPGNEDDDAIRAKDGYAFVLAVQPREEMPCRGCGQLLGVPVRKFAEVRCEYCVYRGKDGRWGCGYFPLNESFIDYLRELDPENRWAPHLKQRLDARNKKIVEQREKAASDALEYGLRENKHRVLGNPRSTYKVNWNDVV